MKPQGPSHERSQKPPQRSQFMLNKPGNGRRQKEQRVTAREEENGQNQHSFDLRQLLSALVSGRNGDFCVRLPSDWTGLGGKIADAFNDIMMSKEMMARELERVSHAVGKEGKIRQRASFSSRGGAWRGMQDSLNTLIADLAWPITEVKRSIGAVAKGDLT